MIEITRIAEVRQLEDESFKAAVYFADDHSAEFLALKKKLKAGEKIMLSIVPSETADKEPDTLSDALESIRRAASIIENHKCEKELL